jgi:8-oxo-dGTP pyrophosphatase MutT (NUDIX family)
VGHRQDTAMFPSRFDILQSSDLLSDSEHDEDDAMNDIDEQYREEHQEEDPEEDRPRQKHPENRHKPVYASGILPISFVNDRCVFLLGEDIRNGYSDFGGKAERFDTSSEECASREFFEETLGLTVSSKEIQNRLTNNAVQVEGLTANNFKYIMFITEIPFDKSLQRYMNRVISFLKSRGLHKLHVEKKSVKWMTLDEMMACDKRKVFENTLMQNKDIIERIGRSTPHEFKQVCREKNLLGHCTHHHAKGCHPENR